jgi:hypothetical protein
MIIITYQDTPRSRRTSKGLGLLGCTTTPPTPSEIELKKTNFVYMTISIILRDLPFSPNQPLKSFDEWYFRILKSEIKIWEMVD